MALALGPSGWHLGAICLSSSSARYPRARPPFAGTHELSTRGASHSGGGGLRLVGIGGSGFNEFRASCSSSQTAIMTDSLRFFAAWRRFPGTSLWTEQPGRPLRIVMEDIEDFPPEIAALIKQITEATLSVDGKALSEFVRKGQVGSVKALVNRNPAVLHESDLLGVTALMHCAKRYSEQHLCIVNFLVQQGADVNAATMNGWTAMHAAATLETGGPVMLRLLASLGAELNSTHSQAPANSGVIHGSPLHVAVRRRVLCNARALVELGCDVEVTNYSGRTALDEAAPTGYRQQAQRVIQAALWDRERRSLAWHLHHACLVEEEDKAVLHVLHKSRRQGPHPQSQRESHSLPLPSLSLPAYSAQHKKLRSLREGCELSQLMHAVVYRLDAAVRQRVLAYV